MRASASAKEDTTTILRALLTQALGSDAAVRTVLVEGLAAARRFEIPQDPDELMRFAWAHLMTPIAETVGVRAATQFISELQTAFSEPRSATRVPVVSDVRPVDQDDIDEPLTERPSAKTRAARRIAVLLVDADRLNRSALARALVQARIDVAVADDAEGAYATLDDLASPLDIVLADADAADFDRLVTRVQLRRPSLRVIARARPPASSTESGTRPVRPGVSAMVWKTLRAADLIEQIRQRAWDEIG